MIKWIEHIFKSNKTALNKPIVSCTFAKISDVLTDKQKNVAFLYYLNHKEHIKNKKLFFEYILNHNYSIPESYKYKFEYYGFKLG